MGKRAWLTDLIDSDILPAIANLQDNEEDRAICSQLALDLRDRWTSRGHSALNQQQSLMAQTRHAIKEKFGDKHFSLDCIDFSRDEYFALNAIAQSQARSRQLSQQYIQDPDAIANRAVQLLLSPEWSEVAAGLAVLTGRRLNEVLKTAKFTVKSQWAVTFQGALKRRGETVPLSFDIPTLTTAKQIVDATERLRQIAPPDANEARVGEASDRHFADLIPLPTGKDRLYTHLWRSVFCTIATFWYCPKHVDELLFKAHILGHFATLTPAEQEDESLQHKRLETFTSSRHYRRYEIDDETIAKYQGQRKGIKLGTNNIEPLEAFAEGMPERQPPARQRQRLSNLRVYQADRQAATEILERFDGKTQADRVAAWIEWTQQQLASITPVTSEELEAIASEDKPEPTKPITSSSPDDSVTDSTDAAARVEEMLQPTADKGFIAPRWEEKLDRLADAIVQLVELQSRQLSNTTPAADSSRPPARAPKTADAKAASLKERSSASSLPSRQHNTGESDGIVSAAIDAIMTHNDRPEQLHDLKWAITINGLKSFSSNQRAIERVIAQRQAEIEAHHQQHQLQPTHNHRHKRKRKISEIIVI